VEIIHITSETGWRGGEYQLYFLIKGLEKLGVSNTLICPANSTLAEKLHDTKSVILPVDHPFNPSNWLKLKKIIKSYSTPILHLHTPDAHTLAYLSPIKKSIPLVLDRRTMFPIKRNVFTKAKYKSKRVRKIICCSNTIAQYVNKSLNIPDRIVTIYDGVELESRQQDHNKNKQQIREELALDQNSEIVGNASALTYEKGWMYFIEIASNVIRTRSNVHFLIIGEGPMEKELKEAVTQMNLIQNIHFLGFRKDALALISGMDALLMPSKTEGLGTVIMEAFLVNTPVVTTRAGGVPELVRHEDTGLICDIGDIPNLTANTLKVLEDSEMAERLTKNAANHLLHFSLESMAEKTLEVYRSVS
jgi:glycosyltransferase involved in cell wall biosynthesis